MNKFFERKGQILIEALVTHMLQIAFVSLVLLSIFGVFATALLHADAYSIARSSLYNTPRACRPARDWPKFFALHLRYECPRPAVVRAQIKFNRLFTFEHQVSAILRRSHE